MGKRLVHIYVYKTETFVRTKVTKPKVESLLGACAMHMLISPRHVLRRGIGLPVSVTLICIVPIITQSS